MNKEMIDLVRTIMLRFLVYHRGFSVRQVAEASGVSKTAVYSVLNGVTGADGYADPVPLMDRIEAGVTRLSGGSFHACSCTAEGIEELKAQLRGKRGPGWNEDGRYHKDEGEPWEAVW